MNFRAVANELSQQRNEELYGVMKDVQGFLKRREGNQSKMKIIIRKTTDNIKLFNRLFALSRTQFYYVFYLKAFLSIYPSKKYSANYHTF